MIKNILTLVGILYMTCAMAQDGEVEIIGEVKDNKTLEAIPYVHVVNINTNEGTASNTEGRFFIQMGASDTLQFSAIGFETYQFTLKESNQSDRLVLTIKLDQSTLELDEVKVFAFKDEYALKRALLNADVPVEAKKEPMKFPGVKYSGRPVEGGGITVGGPLTALGNLFSKEYKEYKKLEVVKRETDIFKKALAKYNREVVIELTGLPEDQVEEFMEFCKVEHSFIMRATEYEIAVVVQQCLADYQKDTEQ